MKKIYRKLWIAFLLNCGLGTFCIAFAIHQMIKAANFEFAPDASEQAVGLLGAMKILFWMFPAIALWSLAAAGFVFDARKVLKSLSPQE